MHQKPIFIDLDYPIDSDYDNHIVFETRPRKKRKGGNLLSEKVYLLDYLYLKVDSTIIRKSEYETTEIGAFARGVLGGKNSWWYD